MAKSKNGGEENGVAVQLRMTRQLLKRLDEYRKEKYRSRSSVIQEAVHIFLEKEGGRNV